MAPASADRLAAQGITLLGHLQALDDREARRCIGEEGPSLVRRARGEDDRRIDPERETKSISAETTFAADLTRPADLEAHLWRLTEKLARRLKEHELSAGGVGTEAEDQRVRNPDARRALAEPTVLPDRLFEAAGALLSREATGIAFRLIGIGANPLRPLAEADRGDLADTETPRRAATQAAIDALRLRFGAGAITRGRGWSRARPG